MACRRSGVRAPVAPPLFLPGEAPCRSLKPRHSNQPVFRRVTRSGRAIVGRSVELEAILIGPRRGPRSRWSESASRASRASARQHCSMPRRRGHGEGLHRDHRRRRRGDPRTAAAGQDDLRQRGAARANQSAEAARNRSRPSSTALQGPMTASACPPTSGCCAPSTRLRRHCVPRSPRAAHRAADRRHPVGRPGQHPTAALRRSRQPQRPMFLMFTIRPEETAQVTELVTLLADLERLGILRRLRVERLRQAETAALLSNVLGGEPPLRRPGHDPRPGRGRAVHRRGADAHLSRGWPAAAHRRHMEAWRATPSGSCRRRYGP